MKVKKLFELISALILGAAMSVAFTGCCADEMKEFISGGTTEATVVASNVCVILSPTANQHKPDISLAENEIYQSCYSYGYKACIVDDGAPYLAFEDDLTNADRISNLSEQNRKLDALAYADSFIEKSEAVKAVTAEKDTIKSIRLAADSLANCTGDKTIVLIDNGISTSGIAAFKTFTNFDADKCIEVFNKNDYPVLDNINIVWYGLGDTVAPQNVLSNDDMANLQIFWEKYLQNAGASNIKFSKNVTVNTTTDNSALPWVSVVDVTPSISKIPDFKSLTEQVENLSSEERNDIFDDALEGGIQLDESSVQFISNSYELLNKETAIKVIKPLGSYLNENPNKKIILMGTTATSGTNQECVEFSLGRAETIKSIMVSDMGVDASQLITVGLGYEHEFHIDDLNNDGSLNEEVAPKNRSVIFIFADSTIGKHYA